MKPYFTCLMLVATTVGICQSLTATIYDLETDLPLPFVNVGLVGKGLGTVSDQEGFFSLNLSWQHQSDTPSQSVSIAHIPIPPFDGGFWDFYDF